MTHREVPYPTDYGPDTRSPLARAFALPAHERPTLKELKRITGVSKRSRPEGPKPELVEAWQHVPETTPENYICGGSALNIPDPVGRGGGDWHRSGTWWYMKPKDERTRYATVAGKRRRTPAMQHVLKHVLRTDGVIDVRKGLAKMGHPQAHEERPVWAASHERSTVEYVLESALRHHEPDPENYMYILDRRTAHRWLATDEQDEWVKAHLLNIAENLPRQRALAIEKWAEYTFGEGEEEP